MKNNFLRILMLIILSIPFKNTKAQTKQISLKDALQLSSVGNRQLQMQFLENQKREVEVKEAKSFLLPDISLNASYSVYGERPVIYLPDGAGGEKLNELRYGGRFVFDGSITASYPIMSPYIKSRIKVAEFNKEIQNLETINTEEQLILHVTQVYLSVLLNKERKVLLEQSLQRNQRALKDSRSLFLQGKNLKTDTLSNYISVQNLTAAISAQDNKINILSVQLKQLMGMRNDVQLLFTDSLFIPVNKSIFQVKSSALSIAFDNRKDLLIHALILDLKKEQMATARAEFKPKLSAVAQYQLQTQGNSVQFWNYGFPRTSFAGVRLSIPIYSGGRLKYRTYQSQIEIKKSELAVTELKTKIEMELVSLTAQLQEAYQQWQIQNKNVEAAEIGYKMMNDRYHNGLGSRLELSDAELALTKAKLDHLQAIYSIRIAEAELNRALGISYFNLLS